MSWQKKARTAIAVFVVIFVAIVFVALRLRKTSAPQAPPPARKDPVAIVENTGSGHVERYRADGTLEFSMKFGSHFTYQDGHTKFGNVQITSTRNGKAFTVASQEAEVVQTQQGELKTAHLLKQVKLTSEATEVTTEDATYNQEAGMLTIPGGAAFRRGRMSGTGDGATYDFNRDVLWLLKNAHIKVGPDDKGQGALDATSGAAGMARAEHYLKLTGKGHIEGEGRLIDADEITITLTEDNQRVQMLQLRGNSSIRGGTGGPQAMSAKDIDLTYGDDGRTLQRAMLMENGVVQLPGEGNSAGQKVSGKTIDIGLAPDGKTVTNLNATENVQVDVPAEGDLPAKRIRSATLTAIGAPGTGLQNANFGGNVEYRETRAARGKLPAVDREARSLTLAVKTKPGFGAVEEADFHGNVHFTDGTDVAADATRGLYHLDKDQIDLMPSNDPGPAAPRVTDGRVTVEARAIEFTLTSRRLKADTKVRSSIQPANKNAATKTEQPEHVPALLKNDQPVTVTSNRLEYDGVAQHAVYSGNARLWQGDTKINGDTIIVDDKTGNLEARTSVHTDMMLNDVDPKTNTKKPTRSLADADAFVYDDAKRLATYTGHAHFVLSEEDVRAEKLELYLLKDSNELDRAEGYGANGEVVVKEKGRIASGARLTYTAANQTYVMTGTPVTVVEQTPPDCKESVGAVLTFQRAVDTVDLKVNGIIRTESKQIACPSETK